MQHVTIHEAKTQLSRLLAAVERGDEVVIARASQPIARLVPYDRDANVTARAPRNCFGVDASGWIVPDDFDAPLPEDVQAAFE